MVYERSVDVLGGGSVEVVDGLGSGVAMYGGSRFQVSRFRVRERSMRNRNGAHSFYPLNNSKRNHVHAQLLQAGA